MYLASALFAAAAVCAWGTPDVAVFRDVPLTGDLGGAQYLDSDSASTAWTFSNGSLTLPATVPGDLISDLSAAGVIVSDIWLDNNFLQPGSSVPLWDSQNWTYTATFSVVSPAIAAALAAGGDVLLAFDSVKMAAYASLNGVYLGCMNDQFQRWNFSVGSLLRLTGSNVLSVRFSTSLDPANNEGRISGASGGWDWGALTNTRSAVGQRTMSKGVIKSAYLVPVTSLSINTVTPLIYYYGAYPTAPLTDSNAGPWLVNVTTHVCAAQATSGTLTVTPAWPGAAPAQVPVNIPAPACTAVNVSMDVAVGQVSLWWPVGTGGAQTMFNISITYAPRTPAGASSVSTMRTVGFRVFYLVTADDSDPAHIAGVDGNGNLTMRFKVNGADVWSRGADIIPMEQVEGRMTSAAFTRMVTSAVEGGFNTLRIDGIDLYYPDAFYDACDAAGVMLYHDIQYSQGNPSPSATPLQDAELRYQVRRLSAHPSLVIYDACNECDPTSGVYASFVMFVFVQEDNSRIPWPSCPSFGWSSGVDQLTSLPNGGTLSPRRYVGAPAPPTAAINASSAACTLQYDTDYCQTCFNEPHPAVASPGDCCAACAANSSCWTAVYDPSSGQCWFKPYNATPVYKAGVTACWPGGNGPIPPTPTPGPSGTFETHGPYLHGSGFPAVNGYSALDPFDPRIPPALAVSTPTGTRAPGTYASEFGCIAMSSFESMSATLSPQYWGLHAGMAPDTCSGNFFNTCEGDNIMAQRNYPCDSIIYVYFGGDAVLPFLNETGVVPFQVQLYLCMMGQALELKADIEVRRSYNSFGTLIWQLNEVWPTGGWGTIEYGSAGRAGQITGGRWKPLHHWLSETLYRDIIMACGVNSACYIKNDGAMSDANVTVTTSLLHLANGSQTVVYTGDVYLPRGAGATVWMCVDGSSIAACPSQSSILYANGCALNGTDCILLLSVQNGPTLSRNQELYVTPASLQLAQPNITWVIGQSAGDGSVPITLTASAVAMYVTLTTAHAGRFFPNSFTLAPGLSPIASLPADTTSISYTVSFLPWATLNMTLLQSTLRSNDLATSMLAASVWQ